LPLLFIQPLYIMYIFLGNLAVKRNVRLGSGFS
jgi:hypothetical protein